MAILVTSMYEEDPIKIEGARVTLVNVKALELVATNWCSLNYALE